MKWNNKGIEPSETLKNQGFKGGYKPPAEVFNYFFNNSEICVDELQKASDEAQSSADSAKAAADKAQSTASSAATAASSAQSTAESAGTAAALAQAAADKAQSTADSAKAAADKAQSTAEGKADGTHKHKKSDITDFPTSMTPTSHASASTTYGLGNSSNYGHVKLSDSTNDTSGESSGVAATPLAVKKAYDMAQKALEAAGEAKELTDEMLHSLFGDNVPDPILENNSPEMIQKVARLGIGANFWSVGDKIGIDVTGEVGTLSLNGIYYAFILGFNHNSAIEAGNSIHFQFGKTSDGLDIAFADSNYDNIANEGFIMNTANIGNVGGWKNSYMRKTICPAFFNALPEEWKNIISHCTKYSDNVGDGSGAEENVTSTLDKIWLLAEYEVRGECEGRGETSYANSSERNFQKQYDYYANGNSLYKGKHDSVYSDCFWWLRSVCANDIVSFCAVTVFSVGAASYLGVLNADKSYGFAPGFVVA